jgi:hypothetical protein
MSTSACLGIPEKETGIGIVVKGVSAARKSPDSGANLPDRSLFSICVRHRSSLARKSANSLGKSAPAGVEPATPGLEGPPWIGYQ